MCMYAQGRCSFKCCIGAAKFQGRGLGGNLNRNTPHVQSETGVVRENSTLGHDVCGKTYEEKILNPQYPTVF